MQSPDFMAPFRPTLLSDLLSLNTIDNDERYGRISQIYKSKNEMTNTI